MIHNVIGKIKSDLVKTFADVNDWFDMDSVLLDYIPQNERWTIRQILEHISLTNYYLLILIRKGTSKAIGKAKITDYAGLLIAYDFDWNKLISIGNHKSFEWNRPEHMEPHGKTILGEVRIKLDNQLQECLGYLQQMPNGEGVLHRAMMSVNNLGKIDMYHYIYFLAQHAKRHITQMEKIKIEMENRK